MPERRSHGERAIGAIIMDAKSAGAQAPTRSGICAIVKIGESRKLKANRGETCCVGYLHAPLRYCAIKSCIRFPAFLQFYLLPFWSFRRMQMPARFGRGNWGANANGTRIAFRTIAPMGSAARQGTIPAGPAIIATTIITALRDAVAARRVCSAFASNGKTGRMVNSMRGPDTAIAK